jgi:hypothetical protein
MTPSQCSLFGWIPKESNAARKQDLKDKDDLSLLAPRMHIDHCAVSNLCKRPN